MPQLESVQQVFEELKQSNPDVVREVQLHLFQVNARRASEQAAAREATEELGEFLTITNEDLHTDYLSMSRKIS